jgi:hypothetical protein
LKVGFIWGYPHFQMPITLSKIEYGPRSLAHFEALEQTCRLHQLSGSGDKYFFMLALSVKATVVPGSEVRKAKFAKLLVSSQAAPVPQATSSRRCIDG